jgi:hypothetical protein
LVGNLTWVKAARGRRTPKGGCAGLVMAGTSGVKGVTVKAAASRRTPYEWSARLAQVELAESRWVRGIEVGARNYLGRAEGRAMRNVRTALEPSVIMALAGKWERRILRVGEEERRRPLRPTSPENTTTP